MDSDWCLFCEKHVMDLGAAYCSKECSRMDKIMNSTKPSLSSLSLSAAPVASSFLAPQTSSSMSSKRLAPMTVTYPSMFRSSNLVPASISSRGGISKAFTPSLLPLPRSVACPLAAALFVVSLWCSSNLVRLVSL